MHILFRRARGMAGVALTWGTVWAAFGAMLGLIFGALRPQDIDSGETPARIAAILGTAGFISGSGFALMLSLLERGRTVLDVSLARVALWGAAGGAVIPLLTSVADSQVFWTCPLGAALATSSVAFARRAERRLITTGHPGPAEGGSA